MSESSEHSDNAIGLSINNNLPRLIGIINGYTIAPNKIKFLFLMEN